MTPLNSMRLACENCIVRHNSTDVLSMSRMYAYQPLRRMRNYVKYFCFSISSYEFCAKVFINDVFTFLLHWRVELDGLFAWCFGGILHGWFSKLFPDCHENYYHINTNYNINITRPTYLTWKFLELFKREIFFSIHFEHGYDQRTKRNALTPPSFRAISRAPLFV